MNKSLNYIFSIFLNIYVNKINRVKKYLKKSIYLFIYE